MKKDKKSEKIPYIRQWVSSLPDSDTGVMGHTAGHYSLGPFDDTLVLWRFSDAGTCCEYTQRLLLRDCVCLFEQSLPDLVSSFTQRLAETE